MSTHNTLFLQLIFSLFAIHHIEMVWLLFLLIEMCNSLMFHKVQLRFIEFCLLLQAHLPTWYVNYYTGVNIFTDSLFCIELIHAY